LDYPWFGRGGRSLSGSDAGLFASYYYSSRAVDYLGWRSALLRIWTKLVMEVDGEYQSWGGDISYFAISSHPWVRRGGDALFGSRAGMYAAYLWHGNALVDFGWRYGLVASTASTLT
jgi:hypothetical protein